MLIKNPRLTRILISQAGLFSAVVTAYTIESYQWLQDDPAAQTVQLLTQISAQLASFSVTPTGGAELSGRATTTPAKIVSHGIAAGDAHAVNHKQAGRSPCFTVLGCILHQHVKYSQTSHFRHTWKLGCEELARDSGCTPLFDGAASRKCGCCAAGASARAVRNPWGFSRGAL